MKILDGDAAPLEYLRGHAEGRGGGQRGGGQSSGGQRGGGKREVRTDDGATPLFMASQNGHTDAVQLLLEEGADVDNARTALRVNAKEPCSRQPRERSGAGGYGICGSSRVG